jgi:sterol desaturase/sphingolipid hydroxylase (fatty acid hydroxylase superfamily)
MLLTLAPILTFWVAAVSFDMLGLNSNEDVLNEHNSITKNEALIRMLQIDVLHVLTTLPWEYAWTIPPEQVYGIRWYYVIGGIFLMDTIEYFTHRIQHEIPWLYKHFHYGHHWMRYSFSFGAFYNAIQEVFLTGPIIGLFFMHIFKFTFVEFQIVSSLAVFWTVMDHTAFFDKVPWLGRKDFHRIHHSVNVDCNFQQPFMTFWDKLLGTDYESVMKKREKLFDHS